MNMTLATEEAIRYVNETHSTSFFLFSMICISIIYLFFYKPFLEQKTALVSVVILRVLITAISYVTLFLIPYTVSILNPLQEINSLVGTYQTIYNIFISLIILVVVIDFIRYAPQMVLRIAGIDLNDPDANRMYGVMTKEMDKLPILRNKNGRRK